MSALAGILDRRGDPPDRAALRRVSTPIRHRGPHHLGTHADDAGFALSVAVLATTPEDIGSTQPVVRGAHCLGFDGRIDNRDDLLRDLGQGARHEDHDRDSDAELVLRAFDRWGDGFLAELVGDFALALWDKARRRLVLARDISGQRSLLYYADGRRVVFGSEIAQVINHPEVPVRPNEAVVAEHIACDLRSREATLYHGVRRVPPAHAVVFEGTGERSVRYWDVDASHHIRHAREDDYVDQFRATLLTAVRSQARAAGPIGAQLSGGLDSSSIAAAVTMTPARERLSAYSLVFPGRPCDETPFIDSVVDALDVRSVRLSPLATPLADPLDEAGLYRHVPDFPNTAMHAPLMRRMREDGVHVLLAGEGGDEFWSGSFAHAADLLAAGHPIQSLQVCHWDSRIPSFSYPRFGFLRLAVLPLLPAPITRVLRATRRRTRRQATLLGPKLAGLVSDASPARLRGATRAQQEAYEDLYNAWAAHGNDTGTRFCGRFDIDQRAPMMDRRLIELAFAFPESLKKRRDVPKYVMRRAVADTLPPQIVARRTKAVFDAVYDGPLARFGPRLLDPAIARCDWVNKSALAGIYHQWQHSRAAHHTRLWMILAIESWYKSVFL